VVQEQTPVPADDPQVPALDARLFDVAHKGRTSNEAPSPSCERDTPGQDSHEPVEPAAAEGVEPAEDSTLPWFIDAFLFPSNLGGVIHLVLLWLLVNLLCPAAMQYLGLGTEYVPFVYTLPVAYVVYYLAECIRHSVGGARRAPEYWMSPCDSSRWDCLTQSVEVVGCVAVCFWPASVYYIARERSDWIFWSLMAGGGFFFPMVLLSVVWFDSYSGLDPVIIMGSIARTFVPYTVIVLLLAAGALLFVKMGLSTYGFYRPPPLALVFRLVQLYLLFVAAGLVGRFYWRYRRRLNWES